MQKYIAIFLKAHPIKQAFFFIWIITFTGSIVYSLFFFSEHGIGKSLHLIQAFVDTKDHLTLVVFYLLIFALRNIFFIPASVLLIVSGILFGVWEGVLWAGIGQTIGAMVGFLFARYFGREFFQHWESPTVAMIDKKLEAHGIMTMAALRIVPILPFDGINFSAGLSRIHGRDFFLGTFLFVWPDVLLYVLIGKAMGGPVFIISLIVVFIAILGGIWYFKKHPHFADIFEKKE
ncbi:MAG: TVP38/TMEM64 family protein [Candidatus Peregrinibacteria bacterium]